jgi:hypothetical protein
MVTLRTKRVGVAFGLLVVLGAVGWMVTARQPPSMDPALVAKVGPVIDEELEKGPWPGQLSSEHPGARWFCVEQVIEIRRAGDELAAGIDALCQEYVRDGHELLAGSGEHGPKVVVLVAEPGGYRVVRVDAPPDGAGFAPWVERSFSAAGAEELTRRGLPADPATQAREAFGLPADAPVRTR